MTLNSFELVLGASGAMVMPWCNIALASQSYCSWRVESGFDSLIRGPMPPVDFRAVCLVRGAAGVGGVDDYAGSFGAKVRDGRYWMVDFWAVVLMRIRNGGQ